MRPTQAEKAVEFRALHDGEAFIIPNPWDAGSAKVLAALGFRALATTSSGFAFTLGRLDGDVTLDEVVDHVRALDRATTFRSRSTWRTATGPIRRTPRRRSPARPRPAPSAARSRTTTRSGRDLRHRPRGRARGRGPEAAAERLELPVHAHGASREPHPRQPRSRRHDRPAAGLRAGGRRSAVRARAAQRRRDPRGCRGLSKPLNVLAHPRLSMSEIVEAGGRRISVGGALAFAAVDAMATAAERMRDTGDFSALGSQVRIREWFGE